jgi:hypothetical protein
MQLQALNKSLLKVCDIRNKQFHYLGIVDFVYFKKTGE